jgi:hypothetical protein
VKATRGTPIHTRQDTAESPGTEKLKETVVDTATEVAARNAARFLARRIEQPIRDDDPDIEKRHRRPKRHGVYRLDSQMRMSPGDRLDKAIALYAEPTPAPVRP